MQTKTTMHLTGPAPRKLGQIPPALAIVLVVLMLAAGLTIVPRLGASQASTAQPTAGMIVLIATAQPQPTAAAVVQVVAPAQAPRYVVGFDSPNGRPLGAIPAPEPSAIVARWGDEWIQTTHDGAPIWVRASELGMSLADIAPAPAAPAPQVVYQVVNQPQEAVQEAPQQPIAPAASEYSPPAQQASTAVPVAPVVPMDTPTDVQRQWIHSQWQAEHCLGSGEQQVCR